MQLLFEPTNQNIQLLLATSGFCERNFKMLAHIAPPFKRAPKRRLFKVRVSTTIIKTSVAVGAEFIVVFPL